MSSLEKLVRFIDDNLPEPVMRGFDSYMEDVIPSPEFRPVGNDQYLILTLQYTGVLTWDRFPFKEFDPRIVFTLLIIWFAEYKDKFEDRYSFENPVADPEITDDETSFLSITIKLIDEVYIIPDENGPIPFNGRRYRINDPEIWVANTALIYGAGNTGGVVNQNDPL